MQRFFNTAGPCNPEDHYMLPAASRLPDAGRLIAQKGYFVIQSPRQTGKTAAMLELAHKLTAEGRYCAVLVSVEVGAPFSNDPGVAEPAILDAWRGSAKAYPPARSPAPSLAGERARTAHWRGTGGMGRKQSASSAVIPWALASGTQDSVHIIRPTWLMLDGSLGVDRVLDAFLAFWKQHGQLLLGSPPYHEIAPYLVLMAFFHRVVNGGGTVEREYAIGSGRMDLCLRYGDVSLAMEFKIWRDGETDSLTEGLAQIGAYLSGLGLGSGWLVIFDRRANQPPISRRTTTGSHAFWKPGHSHPSLTSTGHPSGRLPSGACGAMIRPNGKIPVTISHFVFVYSNLEQRG